MKSSSASTTASNNGACGFHCISRESLKSLLNTVNQVGSGATGSAVEIFVIHDPQIIIHMITRNGGTSQMLGRVKLKLSDKYFYLFLKVWQGTESYSHA